VFSDIIEDFYWNYACLVDTEKPDSFISEVESFFTSKDRSPAVYVTPASKPEGLEESLVENNFECEAKDAWMFFRSEKPNLDSRLDFVKVDSKEQVSSFVELFGVAYGGADDEEAYGDVPEYYVSAVKKAVEQDIGRENVVNYIGHINSEPVAIGSLAVEEGLGYIYNIGVHPEHRSEGFGSDMTELLISKAEEKGADEVMLQTEEGSVNEEFFQDLGFEKEVTGKIMVKK
jgi:ribosomal protein S18 acetylase RimI-like enzyme